MRDERWHECLCSLGIKCIKAFAVLKLGCILAYPTFVTRCNGICGCADVPAACLMKQFAQGWYCAGFVLSGLQLMARMPSVQVETWYGTRTSEEWFARATECAD